MGWSDMSSEVRYTMRTWLDPSFASCKIDASNLETREGVEVRFEAQYENSNQV